MEKETLNSMFENLLHIGNKTNFWDPKMKPYIYGSVNGIHVINLVKTEEKLDEVKKQLKELHTSGKKILFVGTKLQARDAIQKIATDSGHYYVVEKWVPGLLTNWKTIKRRIATYIQLDKDSKTGAFDILTKKEKAGKMLELEKLDKAYRGLKDMKRTPDVVFVIDGVYEIQAIREANILGLTSFAILSTNGDDTIVNNCIPANTNSVKSINYIMEALKESVSGKVVAPVEGPNRREGAPNFKKMEHKKPFDGRKENKVEEIKTEKVKEKLKDSETSSEGQSLVSVAEPKIEKVKNVESKDLGHFKDSISISATLNNQSTEGQGTEEKKAKLVEKKVEKPAPKVAKETEKKAPAKKPAAKTATKKAPAKKAAAKK